jgi:hypothetical protein
MREVKNQEYSKKYRSKYTTLKDIYDSIKKEIRVSGTTKDRMLSYSEYYAILEAFLQEWTNVIAKEQEVLKLPINLGSMYIKRFPHKRPFHVRIDHAKSKSENRVVLYKVPILDDEYTKVMWDRPYKHSKYKVLPLTRFKALINK